MYYRSAALHKVVPRLVYVLLLALFSGVSASSQTGVPPKEDDLVVDYADILSPTEEDVLRNKLVEFDEQTSTQILVVTTRTIFGADIAEYTIELAQAWGVGQAGKDNGAVIRHGIRTGRRHYRC